MPIAGASTASAFNEEVEADLLFLDGIISLRAMDMFSKFSLLFPAQPKTPQEVWDVLRSSWSGIFGPPEGIQMDEGGDGRMRFGRIRAQSVELNRNFQK